MNQALISLHGQTSRLHQFDEAEGEILSACDELTLVLLELAKLQPAIQTAQAIHLNQGPYTELRENVGVISTRFSNVDIDEKQDDSSDLTSQGEAGEAYSDETCPKCMQSFPYHELAFHASTCPGAVASYNALASSSMKEFAKDIENQNDQAFDEQESKPSRKRSPSVSKAQMEKVAEKSSLGHTLAAGLDPSLPERKIQNNLIIGANFKEPWDYLTSVVSRSSRIVPLLQLMSASQIHHLAARQRNELGILESF